MPFDKKKFSNEKLEPRTMEVRVPALSPWFSEDEEPIFVVRGLGFDELCKADNAADNNKEILKLISGLAGKTGDEVATGIKNVFGIGEETAPNTIRRIQHLIMGSIDPEIDEQDAVRIATHFAVEFKDITNQIVMLTGQGSSPGKQQGSSESPE